MTDRWWLRIYDSQIAARQILSSTKSKALNGQRFEIVIGIYSIYYSCSDYVNDNVTLIIILLYMRLLLVIKFFYSNI